MKILKKYLSQLRDINPDILKVIALITMTIDHVCHVLFPGKYMFLRFIGRFTLPIFSFLFASHLSQKDLFKKYILRLLPFALLSLLIVTPFEFFIKDYFKLSILWTFFLALITLFCLEKIIKEDISITIKTIFILLTLGIGFGISFIVDYGYFGFLFILSLYWYLKTKQKRYLIPTLTFSFLLNSAGFLTRPQLVLIMCCASLFMTIFLLFQDNKKSHKRFLKPWWLFYAYFPIHFFILYLIYIFYF